ncbi:hypothetical protein SAY87_008760 [Trapa incisa]|uniref:BHLH domain-containing protein n=1 Tax=Trapa incisa TaxID=236973 RepID=A0AAN7K0N5_9MYRT|nr:hypothetical protein SAY87_008760 [Trapa incisa]
MEFIQNQEDSSPPKEVTENRMNCLYSKLTTLIPHSYSKGLLWRSDQGNPSSPSDLLRDAVNYIEELQTRVERLKDGKESMLEHDGSDRSGSSCTIGKTPTRAFVKPEIMIQEVGSALKVVIISSKTSCQLIFREAIRVLQEEGADIVSANFSIVGDIAFHSIHSQVEDYSGNTWGSAAAAVSHRLKEVPL